MAFYATGTATGPGATAAFYDAVLAQAIANSWTSHDVITGTSGSKDIVLRGDAMDSTADNRPFVRMTQSGNNINFIGYGDWDTSTHAGIYQASQTTSAQMALSDASFVYALWINGQGMALAAKISGVYVHTYMGYVRRGLSSAMSGVTKTSQAYSSGVTSLNVASDLTGKLLVGQKVWIMNYAHSSGSSNASNAELVTISAVASGSITLSSATTKAYDSGALIGHNVCPLAIGNATTGVGAATSGSIYAPLNTDATRTGNVGQTLATDNLLLWNEANTGPGSVVQMYGSGLCSFSSNVSSKVGAWGFPYGYVSASGNNQALDDIHNDGVYTYLTLAATTASALLMGPREL